MHKLLLLILVAAFLMEMNALQTDEELAMQALFQAKHALNAATHAAAQQIDETKLAWGTVTIDPENAEKTALHYLQSNLRLDNTNRPLPGTFWKGPVTVLSFTVIDESYVFPYVYTNPAYGYSAVFRRPGVAMIVRLEYPRIFQILKPVVWVVKSSSELVY